MTAEPFSDEEMKAIRALQRLARTWPQTIRLEAASGTLLVQHSDSEMPFHEPQCVFISGIPCDGGDPDWCNDRYCGVCNDH
jgi:hypothetical protein